MNRIGCSSGTSDAKPLVATENTHVSSTSNAKAISKGFFSNDNIMRIKNLGKWTFSVISLSSATVLSYGVLSIPVAILGVIHIIKMLKEHKLATTPFATLSNDQLEKHIRSLKRDGLEKITPAEITIVHNRLPYKDFSSPFSHLSDESKKAYNEAAKQFWPELATTPFATLSNDQLDKHIRSLKPDGLNKITPAEITIVQNRLPYKDFSSPFIHLSKESNKAYNEAETQFWNFLS